MNIEDNHTPEYHSIIVVVDERGKEVTPDNKPHTLEDCYRTEIDCELRWCLREKKLSYEQYTMLKERYVYNGNR